MSSTTGGGRGVPNQPPGLGPDTPRFSSRLDAVSTGSTDFTLSFIYLFFFTLSFKKACHVFTLQIPTLLFLFSEGTCVGPTGSALNKNKNQRYIYLPLPFLLEGHGHSRESQQKCPVLAMPASFHVRPGLRGPGPGPIFHVILRSCGVSGCAPQLAL